VDQLDTYSATRLFQQQKTYTSPPGNHTVSVAVSGNKNPASAGPFLIFDAFVVGGLTPQFLAMYGQPGDYIAAGQRFFTSGSATFNGNSADGGVSVGVNLTSTAGAFWYVILAAPPGQLLAPGTYENAVRSTSRASGVPGLDVFGEGRGCNALTGRFIIDALQLSGSTLVNLHATFEQHCEGGTPALFGEIKYSGGPPLTLEDTDSRVTFNGSWTSFADPSNSGGTATYADAGASVALEFTGTFVNFVYLKQPNTGIATIAIDGALVDQLDTYAASRQFRQTKTYLLTGAGTHAITATVSGAKNVASGGVFVIFDAFVAEAAAPTLTSTSAAMTQSAGFANTVDTGDVLEFVFSEPVSLTSNAMVRVTDADCGSPPATVTCATGLSKTIADLNCGTNATCTLDTAMTKLTVVLTNNPTIVVAGSTAGAQWPVQVTNSSGITTRSGNRAWDLTTGDTTIP